MAITLTNLQSNHRGVCFRFIGDGATTVLPTLTQSQLATLLRPNHTPTSVCISTPTDTAKNDKDSNTGLTTRRAGTAQTSSATMTPTGGLICTVNPAVVNAVTAEAEVTFSNAS